MAARDTPGIFFESTARQAGGEVVSLRMQAGASHGYASAPEVPTTLFGFPDYLVFRKVVMQMAAPAEVTWAEAAEDGSEIVALGGVKKSLFGRSEWTLSAEDAIRLMEQDEWRFFVETDEETEWLVVSEEVDGSKKISADGPVSALL